MMYIFAHALKKRLKDTSDKKKRVLKDKILDKNMKCEVETQQKEFSGDQFKVQKELEKVRSEKIILSSQLKRQRRKNNNLKKQLNEERSFYLKEKQLYCDEMNKSKMRLSMRPSFPVGPLRNEKDMCRLRAENSRLTTALMHREHTTYNLCLKFLRMKRTKDHLMQRLRSTEEEYYEMLKSMAKRVDDSRKEINYLCSNALNEPLPTNNAFLLEVLKRNSLLMQENAELHMELRRLRQRLDGKDIVSRQMSREVGLVETAQDAVLIMKSQMATKPKRLKRGKNSKENQAEKAASEAGQKTDSSNEVLSMGRLEKEATDH